MKSCNTCKNESICKMYAALTAMLTDWTDFTVIRSRKELYGCLADNCLRYEAVEA